MTKTLDENFADWEGHVFGFGYGSGEPHTVPALRRFFALCPDKAGYDFEVLERELTPTVAWLLINALAKADVLEYGTSPRFAWLTARGLALKAYLATKTDDEAIELCCYSSDYVPCYPDACNCGPNGYEDGRKCVNPFWC